MYREENPDLMDAHRTGASRSIPILIQLDDQFNVTGVWGPRPEPAQRLVMERRSNPATAAAYSEELHKWYAQDRQNTIVQEMNALLALASQ